MLKRLPRKLDKPAVHVQFAQLDTQYLKPKIDDRVFYLVFLCLLTVTVDLFLHF